jgi:outer membrane protein TolC
VYLIADEVGTKYVLNEALDYRRIKVSLEDATSMALQNNPAILTNKIVLDNAERSYDVALKENMPLPKFSVNLGAYNKHFGTGTNQTLYENYNGGNNVELVASINASWAITGEDGLFNSNKLAQSRIGKEIAAKELDKNRLFAQSYIRQTYQNILSLQNQIVILEARLPTLQKSFDTILENYLSGKTKYYDFHLSLQELTETKILFEQTKYNHLKEKLALAKLAGLEDFPGENFEQLATRVKGK